MKTVAGSGHVLKGSPVPGVSKPRSTKRNGMNFRLFISADVKD